MNYQEFEKEKIALLDNIRKIDLLNESIQTLKTKIQRNERNSKSVVQELIIKEQESLQNIKKDIALERKQLMEERAFFQNQKLQDMDALIEMSKEKSLGFPWLAKAYADYFELRDNKIADFLKRKSQPAVVASDALKEIAFEKKAAIRENKITRYLLEYYENLFPWLIDFRGEDLDDLVRQILDKKDRMDQYDDERDDSAKQWLTESEYNNLSAPEKYQLALDRYWRKKKTRWEIGRDYERYVGYQYESKGYNVYYQGIIKGLDDLGRDLIVTKDDTVIVIQCKNWSKEKQIHEKHIFQLFGTAIAYRLDHPKVKVLSLFTTSTTLTDRAKQYADMLGIKIQEDYPLDKYPCIKCNVSGKSNEKIYHLPFDQQYDKTLVEEEKNECYVWSVKEAEKLGFRRAFKWRGNPNL